MLLDIMSLMTPKKLEIPVEIPHSIVRPRDEVSGKEEPKSEIIVPPPEPTLEEKINSNFYKCDTNLQWIRADTAECKDKSTNITQTSQTSATGSPVASGGVNLYPSSPYQCTRYAKDRRPDIPNRLGDARGWYDKLASMGWSVGLVPRVGALGIAVSGNHVVYIERVNPDGTVHLSERNWDWHGSYNERDAPASSFRYVY